MEKIGNLGLVPVAVIQQASDAPQVAKALMDGGLPLMEITMRTAAGLSAIKAVRESYPDFLVGAGTVLTLEQCRQSIEAGAEFIVTPGFNPDIVDYCIAQGMPVTPGCVTPTEIEMALQRGLKILKFFPAGVYGGIKACESLQGPYKSAGIKFIPSGGVSLKNLDEYSDKHYIHAIGGGWLADPKAIAEGNFDLIKKTAQMSVNALLGFRIAHVGINTADDQQALNLANQIDYAFGLGVNPAETSYFLATEIEIMKSKFLGTSGHIAIGTNHLGRALYHLTCKGFKVDKDHVKYVGDQMVSAYLTGEFGGFAFHVVQR